MNVVLVATIALAVLAFVGIPFAKHKERQQARERKPSRSWPLDDELALTRAVRESFDGLTYRRTR